MSRLTYERFTELVEKGRGPIPLPAEVYFDGNEILQKTPGRHHLPQYQKTGTYNLPNVREQRKRVAMDRAKRLINSKMTEVEMRKVGGIDGLNRALAEFGIKIDESQKEVAMMNAQMLEEEGQAKREMRQEEKMRIFAEHGIPYREIKPETGKFTPQAQVKAAGKAVTDSKHLKPEDDLSGLKDESEKDKNELTVDENVALGQDSGVVETSDVTFTPTTNEE